MIDGEALVRREAGVSNWRRAHACFGRTPSVSASERLTLASARRSDIAASCCVRRLDIVLSERPRPELGDVRLTGARRLLVCGMAAAASGGMGGGNERRDTDADCAAEGMRARPRIELPAVLLTDSPREDEDDGSEL